MSKLGKLAFLAGIALAVVVAFIQGDFAPWIVAGLGLVVGFLNIRARELRSFLLAGTALTVTLMSIQAQPYNPAWLTAIVLYEKVFITHALLVVAFVAFFRTAKD